MISTLLLVALIGITSSSHAPTSDQSQRGMLIEDPDWPENDPHLGYVSKITMGNNGDPYVIDRRDRAWASEGIFDDNHVFMRIDEGPIAEDTIKRLDSATGDVVDSFGKDIFYMPHGIYIDHDGNYWATDAALHQVLKFNSRKELVMTLGERFVPASNNDVTNRFCEPTDVVVAASTGDFYVSDGYCNRRVVRFNAAGEYVSQITYDFDNVHSLALIESEDVLCVSDNKHKRIVCFTAGIDDVSLMGNVVRIYDDLNGDDIVYGITYSSANRLLYGVTATIGFTIDFFKEDEGVIAKWRPDLGFQVPHGVALSQDGADVFVCEVAIDRQNVWKFVKQNINNK